jgi:hydrophobic/amphiphilic exporter-1 (mainly G- bacteria), HAE1 family
VILLSDHTQSIQAAIAEVELTLIISIVLALMMIYVLLRNIPATLITSATVPLALAGTAAIMCLCNFSLDNLSLMALIIAVGFVIDDAIVMLENIYRHLESGLTPMRAARKGAAEVSFTIISISV